MHSGEGEVVPFSQKLYPTGNVEDWLCEVERVMKESLRDTLYRALLEYPEVGRNVPQVFYSHHIILARRCANSRKF